MEKKCVRAKPCEKNANILLQLGGEETVKLSEDAQFSIIKDSSVYDHPYYYPLHYSL